MKRTAVSLFAGVGGFDLALERNGYNVVAACEIDKHASAVLAKRFPNTKLFGDVKELTGNDLRAAGFIPEGGILTGGFPCQDLSVAGKRLGFGGQRSSLFYEIARLADETQAEWLVLENVPGLLTSQRGADMGAVIGTLVELGYGVSWRVLDAQNFGVPQRRRRVFIVARRAGDVASCAQVLFERESLRRDFAPSRASGQETAGSLGQSPAEPVIPIHDQATRFAGKRGDKQDGKGNGLGIGSEADPMFTLTKGDRHAVTEPVAFDEMNFTTAKTHHTLRSGTPQSTGLVEPTLYEPHHGDGRATEGHANTLNARMGTGGNNLPVLIESEISGGGQVVNTLSAELYHHGTVVNQDVNSNHLVICTDRPASPNTPREPQP